MNISKYAVNIAIGLLTSIGLYSVTYDSTITTDKIISSITSSQKKIITTEVEVVEEQVVKMQITKHFLGLDYLWPDTEAVGKSQVKAKVYIGVDFHEFNPQDVEIDNDKKKIILVLPEVKKLICSINKIDIQNPENNEDEINQELNDIEQVKKLINQSPKIAEAIEESKRKYKTIIADLVQKIIGYDYKIVVVDKEHFDKIKY